MSFQIDTQIIPHIIYGNTQRPFILHIFSTICLKFITSFLSSITWIISFHLWCWFAWEQKNHTEMQKDARVFEKYSYDDSKLNKDIHFNEIWWMRSVVTCERWSIQIILQQWWAHPSNLACTYICTFRYRNSECAIEIMTVWQLIFLICKRQLW